MPEGFFVRQVMKRLRQPGQIPTVSMFIGDEIIWNTADNIGYILEGGAVFEIFSATIDYNAIDYGLTPFETTNQYSVAPVTALTLNTSPLIDGFYQVDVYFKWSCSSKVETYICNVWIDGVEHPSISFQNTPTGTSSVAWVSYALPLIIADGLEASHLIEYKIGKLSAPASRRAQLYAVELQLKRGSL